ncbi:hypothetical protein [Komagataeibacter rhaeticus]|uniref:Uncharacterized protein n=1 Tax=Komagataeibacter rhaeticus TaxID=215221 RepID=A0A858JLE2_9PROT|nr:hypothetical protein [Komagataeibacter rhaeticus]QIP36444.1 hypothetical protein GWK63_14055 [Komagataeibacter rhaeticus]QOC46214.1 hypothetical protein ICJ78_14115 [Komagataeibacter rhaeticus]WPP21153.1 hypothetical protein SCD25_12080 [Komagataeibacter rhaeticus]
MTASGHEVRTFSGPIPVSASTGLTQVSFYPCNASIDRLRGAACDPGAVPC